MKSKTSDQWPLLRGALLVLATIGATSTQAPGTSTTATLTVGALYLLTSALVAGSSESPWTRVIVSYLDVGLGCYLMVRGGTASGVALLSCCGLVALASVGRNINLGMLAGVLGALGTLTASYVLHSAHFAAEPATVALLKGLPTAIGVFLFGQLGRVNLRNSRDHSDGDAQVFEEDGRTEERIITDAINKSRGLAQEKQQKEIELYDKSRKLETLIRISHRMTTARRPEEVLGLVTHKAKDELNTTLAFALMVEDETIVPVVRAGNFSEPTVRCLTTPVGQGLLGEALQNDVALRLNAQDAALLQSSLGNTPDRIRTLMVVPLKGPQDRLPFGLLGVANLLVGSEFKDGDEDYLRLLATDASIAIKNIWLYEGLRRSYDEMIHALAQAIEAKDPYTHGHVGRVQATSVLLARHMKLPEDEIEIIAKAAILHDVGKISTPNEILNKPGALTPVERRKMDDHVTSSIHILKDIDSLPDEVFEMVLYHHERYDGRGYPYGLRGDELPIGAQIISVADAFDAMTSDRPYRKGFPLEKALDLLRQSAGTQFNDRVVHALLGLHQQERTIPSQLELAPKRLQM